VSIGAMSSVFLTMQAGGALQSALHLRGRAARLISEHSQAAHDLAFIYVAFTAIVIITLAAQRISGGMPTGLGILDRALCPCASGSTSATTRHSPRGLTSAATRYRPPPGTRRAV
jgi:hypothetical protein